VILLRFVEAGGSVEEGGVRVEEGGVLEKNILVGVVRPDLLGEWSVVLEGGMMRRPSISSAKLHVLPVVSR